MTEFSTSLVEPETPEISTQLDNGRPSDETISAKPPTGPESRLEAIKRAASDVAPKEASALKENGDEPDTAPEPKAESETKPKPEAESEAKPEEPAKAVDQERPRPAGKDHIEPPAKFLPRAKELWINTPREVKSEIQRVMTEYEQETTQARESVKEFEAVRPYAEMAKQGGTTLDAALGNYVRMEQTLRSNPAEGFRGLLSNMRMNPVQAIGHILSAFNIRPEQLAAHVSQNPNDYTPLARQQQPQQQQAPQTPREVEELRQKVAMMEQSMQHRDVEQNIISPFAAENPRYYELHDTIAAFLESDMVPKTLGPSDRLAAAYDMAVRISPQVQRQAAPDQTEAESQADSRAGKDFGGTKSVRGAPASGVETTSVRKGKLSRGDSIKAAMAELGIA